MGCGSSIPRQASLVQSVQAPTKIQSTHTISAPESGTLNHSNDSAKPSSRSLSSSPQPPGSSASESTAAVSAPPAPDSTATASAANADGKSSDAGSSGGFAYSQTSHANMAVLSKICAAEPLSQITDMMGKFLGPSAFQSSPASAAGTAAANASSSSSGSAGSSKAHKSRHIAEPPAAVDADMDVSNADASSATDHPAPPGLAEATKSIPERLLLGPAYSTMVWTPSVLQHNNATNHHGSSGNGNHSIVGAGHSAAMHPGISGVNPYRSSSPPPKHTITPLVGEFVGVGGSSAVGVSAPAGVSSMGRGGFGGGSHPRPSPSSSPTRFAAGGSGSSSGASGAKYISEPPILLSTLFEDTSHVDSLGFEDDFPTPLARTELLDGDVVVHIRANWPAQEIQIVIENRLPNPMDVFCAAKWWHRVGLSAIDLQSSSEEDDGSSDGYRYRAGRGDDDPDFPSLPAQQQQQPASSQPASSSTSAAAASGSPDQQPNSPPPTWERLVLVQAGSRRVYGRYRVTTGESTFSILPQWFVKRLRSTNGGAAAVERDSIMNVGRIIGAAERELSMLEAVTPVVGETAVWHSRQVGMAIQNFKNNGVSFSEGSTNCGGGGGKVGASGSAVVHFADSSCVFLPAQDILGPVVDLFPQDLSHGDICGGILSNAALTASIVSMVHAHSGFLRSLFMTTMSTWPVGACLIRLCDRSGMWRTVLVDTQVPVIVPDHTSSSSVSTQKRLDKASTSDRLSIWGQFAASEISQNELRSEFSATKSASSSSSSAPPVSTASAHHRNGNPHMCSLLLEPAVTDDLWPVLIEKAVCRFVGGYDRLVVDPRQQLSSFPFLQAATATAAAVVDSKPRSKPDPLTHPSGPDSVVSRLNSIRTHLRENLSVSHFLHMFSGAPQMSICFPAIDDRNRSDSHINDPFASVCPECSATDSHHAQIAKANVPLHWSFVRHCNSEAYPLVLNVSPASATGASTLNSSSGDSRCSAGFRFPHLFSVIDSVDLTIRDLEIQLENCRSDVVQMINRTRAQSAAASGSAVAPLTDDEEDDEFEKLKDQFVDRLTKSFGSGYKFHLVCVRDAFGNTFNELPESCLADSCSRDRRSADGEPHCSTTSPSAESVPDQHSEPVDSHMSRSVGLLKGWVHDLFANATSKSATGLTNSDSDSDSDSPFENMLNRALSKKLFARTMCSTRRMSCTEITRRLAAGAADDRQKSMAGTSAGGFRQATFEDSSSQLLWVPFEMFHRSHVRADVSLIRRDWCESRLQTELGEVSVPAAVSPSDASSKPSGGENSGLKLSDASATFLYSAHEFVLDFVDPEMPGGIASMLRRSATFSPSAGGGHYSDFDCWSQFLPLPKFDLSSTDSDAAHVSHAAESSAAPDGCRSVVFSLYRSDLGTTGSESIVSGGGNGNSSSSGGSGCGRSNQVGFFVIAYFDPSISPQSSARSAPSATEPASALPPMAPHTTSSSSPNRRPPSGNRRRSSAHRISDQDLREVMLFDSGLHNAADGSQSFPVYIPYGVIRLRCIVYGWSASDSSATGSATGTAGDSSSTLPVVVSIHSRIKYLITAESASDIDFATASRRLSTTNSAATPISCPHRIFNLWSKVVLAAFPHVCKYGTVRRDGGSSDDGTGAYTIVWSQSSRVPWLGSSTVTVRGSDSQAPTISYGNANWSVLLAVPLELMKRFGPAANVASGMLENPESSRSGSFGSVVSNACIVPAYSRGPQSAAALSDGWTVHFEPAGSDSTIPRPIPVALFLRRDSSLAMKISS